VAADAELETVVTRLAALGATRTDANPAAADRGDVAMCDPDGNEFRVLARR
jgi:hypothetical protein